MPPLPLVTVAAMLPREWSLRLVDENIEKLTDADLAWADMVFFSAMAIQQESLFVSIARAKRACKRVVLGGPYATSYHDEIRESAPGMVDNFILGECEHTMPEFLADFAIGKAREVYEGPREGSRVLTDIKCSPTPRFDLIKFEAYSSMMVQWSRGCPHDCEFCDITKLMGRVPRLKSISQMLAELNLLYRLGWRGPVFFVDDNFIGNKSAVLPLLQAIVQWQEERAYPFSFFTEATVKLAGMPELLRAMVQAGFCMVFVGIESPNDDALKKTNKGQNLGRDGNARAYLLESVRVIQRAGMEVTAGFIVGLDGDTEFETLLGFVEEAGIPTAMAGLLAAIKGTDLHRRLTEEGRILEDTHSGNQTDFVLNFRTQLPRKQVLAAYRRVVLALYEPSLRSYFERCFTLIENIGPVRIGKSVYGGGAGFRALVLSLVVQGFSRQGPAYMRFLAKVLWHRPELLPMAVRLAVYGYHFERETREKVNAYDFREFLRGRLEYVESIIRGAKMRGAVDIKRLETQMSSNYARARTRFLAFRVGSRKTADEAFAQFRARLRALAAEHGVSLPWRKTRV